MPALFRLKVVPLIFILALYFACFLNWPVLLHFCSILASLSGVKIGFVMSIPVVLVCALNVVFIPFSFRFILKPFFTFLLISGALVSYSMLKYKVVFDTVMIQNITETSTYEALSYFNTSSVLWVVSAGVLPAILLCLVRVEYPDNLFRGIFSRMISMLTSVLVILLVAVFYYQDYASVGRNNTSLNREIVPANYIYSTFRYIADTYFTHVPVFRQVATDAIREKRDDKPVLMFLVVGETARKQNFSLNGYPRETNVYTQKESGFISFSHVASCGTSTAVSVPCMFSDMPRAAFDGKIAASSENVLDILHRTGVSILWKENDGGCKGVCKRIPTITVDATENKHLCNGRTCYDEVLLDNLDNEISQMTGNDKMVIFHMIGSHGPTYFERYPEEHRHFVPDCPRSDIENCTNEELINTYDNTVRYTDYVLSLMAKKLNKYNDTYRTVLLYVSDHGESLGEYGLYLHGTPYKLAPEQQTQVPLLLWMSPDFISSEKINVSCLSDNARNRHYSHDYLFSSLLGIWNIRTEMYNKERDILAECRK